MNIAYVKQQINETKTGIDKKLSFSGNFEGLTVDIKLAGDKDTIQKFVDKQRLQHFGQLLQIEITNEQTTL